VNDEKYNFIRETALRNVVEKAGRRNIVKERWRPNFFGDFQDLLRLIHPQ